MKKYITVLGAIAVDIGGVPDKRPTPHDSMPGRVSISLGGVGFNVARNLSMLGADTKLIAAFGDDVFARRAMEECEKYGIDASFSPHFTGADTAVYMFVTDERGEMTAAVNDMRINSLMTADRLFPLISVINRGDALIVDANFPADVTAQISKNCVVPIFADCVSAAKVMNLEPSVDKFKLIKPNREEAEALVGIRINSYEDALSAAEILRDRGAENVIITLGRNGVVYSGPDGAGKLPSLCRDITNTTGSGDAMLAAAVMTMLAGGGIRDAAVNGSGAAAIVAGDAGAFSPSMSWESIEKYINNYKELH